MTPPASLQETRHQENAESRAQNEAARRSGPASERGRDCIACQDHLVGGRVGHKNVFRKAKTPKSLLDPPPGSIGLPLTIVAVNSAPVWKVVRQQAPCTPAPLPIADRIDNSAKRNLPRHSHRAARWNTFADRLPLAVGEIARIVRHIDSLQK